MRHTRPDTLAYGDRPDSALPWYCHSNPVCLGAAGVKFIERTNGELDFLVELNSRHQGSFPAAPKTNAPAGCLPRGRQYVPVYRASRRVEESARWPSGRLGARTHHHSLLTR